MIPARYAATRFPGKLMQDLGGKPVIVRTYESAKATQLFDEVYVVTDSEIIFNEITSHGGIAIMSRKEHECGSDRIAEAIEDVGGYINAYTSREMTAYYVRVLEDDVPLALDVISDIVLNSIFDPKELEIERGVILQEIGQSLDTPDDIIFDWLQEAAYPNQSLGRTILGSSERVSNFSQEDLLKFVSEHYGPEQMVLSAAGAVNHNQIVSQIKALFDKKAPILKTKTPPSIYHGGERYRWKKI